MRFAVGATVKSCPVGSARTFSGVIESSQIDDAGEETYVVRDYMHQRWRRSAAQLEDVK